MRRHIFCLLTSALALVAAGDAGAEIEIGFANPLSGPYALTGARNRIAVEMAVEDLNRDGGVLGDSLSLVAVDDACGLQASVEAARRLVEAGCRWSSATCARTPRCSRSASTRPRTSR